MVFYFLFSFHFIYIGWRRENGQIHDPSHMWLGLAGLEDGIEWERERLKKRRKDMASRGMGPIIHYQASTWYYLVWLWLLYKSRNLDKSRIRANNNSYSIISVILESGTYVDLFLWAFMSYMPFPPFQYPLSFYQLFSYIGQFLPTTPRISHSAVGWTVGLLPQPHPLPFFFVFFFN